jgi:hypothetical protein
MAERIISDRHRAVNTYITAQVVALRRGCGLDQALEQVTPKAIECLGFKDIQTHTERFWKLFEVKWQVSNGLNMESEGCIPILLDTTLRASDEEETPSSPTPSAPSTTDSDPGIEAFNEDEDDDVGFFEGECEESVLTPYDKELDSFLAKVSEKKLIPGPKGVRVIPKLDCLLVCTSRFESNTGMNWNINGAFGNEKINQAGEDKLYYQDGRRLNRSLEFEGWDFRDQKISGTLWVWAVRLVKPVQGGRSRVIRFWWNENGSDKRRWKHIMRTNSITTKTS